MAISFSCCNLKLSLFFYSPRRDSARHWTTLWLSELENLVFHVFRLYRLRSFVVVLIFPFHQLYITVVVVVQMSDRVSVKLSQLPVSHLDLSCLLNSATLLTIIISCSSKSENVASSAMIVVSIRVFIINSCVSERDKRRNLIKTTKILRCHVSISTQPNAHKWAL